MLGTTATIKLLFHSHYVVAHRCHYWVASLVAFILGTCMAHFSFINASSQQGGFQVSSISGTSEPMSEVYVFFSGGIIFYIWGSHGH